MGESNVLGANRVAATSQQLTQDLTARTQAAPVPGSLRVNTSVASLNQYSYNDIARSGDQLSTESTDSVTELLSQIDRMVGTSQDLRTRRSRTEHQAKATRLARRELEAQMANLQVMCQQEMDMNAMLADRISSEEARIKELFEQIERAQQNIAYVAKQRVQLVDRLQTVEARQRDAMQQMAETEKESERCTEDVTLLDNKMFGMERRQVQILRQSRNKTSEYSNGFKSASSRSSGEHTVVGR
ncbi:hypothetical protein H4R26_002448 [Coemansia thaxteri]|uniref:Uncharacterized protein n=1 Tax=Coemansia thaxteri TaxID=2663907 RepID=A0A9W8EIG3_9FUNG|nr:hypothetical protein H4R26_002448 [Coemansia thaxteri]